MQWEPDRGLQYRMAVALVLLALMPLAFVTAMSLAISYIVVPLAELLLETQIAWRFTVSLPLVLVLTVGGLAFQFLFGDRLALHSIGARRVERADYPEVYARLDRLSTQAVLPTPRLAVAPTRVPNAFATGRSPETATIAVTRGLLDTLSGDELDAVLAHELSHVKNRDVAVMSLAYLLPSFTYVVATIAYTLLGGLWNVIGHFHHSDSDDARPLLVFIVLFVVTALLTILIATVFWVGSFLLFRLLSQYREYAADRGAARITGNPLALASALGKIDETMAGLPDRDLREIDGGVEALYIAPLDLPMFTDGDKALISRDIFPETHPPTATRIERLQALARDLETR
ncbi:M48 family metalloprotease [Haladaptatus sp. DYSN1]|uniref:M48 family metalloprotease n=1 Tax=unclassified Haladaptatus TaxID=2622732 RepID=UPI0024068C9B|nr:M48 family metalloprotease [Haladaptatus sp. DYSN1]